MKKLILNVRAWFSTVLGGEGLAKAYIGGLFMAYVSMMVVAPVHAQDLRTTGINIFNAVYGVVGIIGALALLFHAINWKFGGMLGGSGDPKKSFVMTAIAVAAAFGVVAIIQFIKGAVGAGAGVGGL